MADQENINDRDPDDLDDPRPPGPLPIPAYPCGANGYPMYLHLLHHLQAPFHRRCQMLFLRLHRQVMVTFLHPMVFLLVPTMDLHTRVCLHILVYLLHRPNLFLVRHLLQSNHQSTTMMG